MNLPQAEKRLFRRPSNNDEDSSAGEAATTSAELALLLALLQAPRGQGDASATAKRPPPPPQANLLLDLPDDVSLRVLRHLDAPDLCRMRSVTRRHYDLAARNAAGWTRLCRRTWDDKVFVAAEARQLWRQASSNHNDDKASSMRAYRVALQDATRRQAVRLEEFLYDPATGAGTVWSFRFKQSAGADWTAADPWYNGRPARQLVFLRDGTCQAWPPPEGVTPAAAAAAATTATTAAGPQPRRRPPHHGDEMNVAAAAAAAATTTGNAEAPAHHVAAPPEPVAFGNHNNNNDNNHHHNNNHGAAAAALLLAADLALPPPAVAGGPELLVGGIHPHHHAHNMMDNVEDDDYDSDEDDDNFVLRDMDDDHVVVVDNDDADDGDDDDDLEDFPRHNNGIGFDNDNDVNDVHGPLLARMSWRMITRPMDLPTRPAGSYVRITVGGRDVPTYAVRRSPVGNWGFVMESCWGLFASFELPARQPPAAAAAQAMPPPLPAPLSAPRRRLRRNAAGNAQWIWETESNVSSETAAAAALPDDPWAVLRDDRHLQITNEIQWREAFLYNVGARVLPEGEEATDDFDRAWGGLGV